jgi:2-C-methyl-D-erythritol 4-phosphate cytidylyltransferase/2-C-methyl-D-erythritol 2,4-cyclodiphosphate synthase
MSVSVIIAAGGQGTRLGAGVPKQWLAIDGLTLLERSVAAFDAHPRVSEIVIVVPPGTTDAPIPPTATAQRVVTGGARRQDSVAEGFAAVSAQASVILVHDAARPFVTADVIDRAIDGALAGGAVVPAVPVHDTVKQIVPGDLRVVGTLPRETLFLAQTPQAFRRDVLAAAIEAGRGGASGTDEAMLAEQAGHEVRLVAGDDANVKITTAADLERARAGSLPDRIGPDRMGPPAFRIGTGYDLHVFVERRPLILGGVRIPYDRGLKGHSDADAVCHAVTDAILGAANLGDIGRLFPDTDPRYKDADSLVLLADAAARVRAAGWLVVNVDVVVIAERPKIGPHAAAMQASLAATLGVEAGAIAIKGKTNEGVDATGRGEALAVHAVALIARVSR